MPPSKTTTLTFRIEPGLKEALRTAATREHRSIANMVEVLIRDYCDRHEIGISVVKATSAKDGSLSGGKKKAGRLSRT